MNEKLKPITVNGYVLVLGIFVAGYLVGRTSCVSQLAEALKIAMAE